MLHTLSALLLLLLPLPLAAQAGGERRGATGPEMVTIPGRAFVPPYATTDRPTPAPRAAPDGDGASDSAPAGPSTVGVETFELDAVPVTEADFLAFVRAEPRWRKDQAPLVLAGEGYLSHWSGPLDPAAEGESLRRPVTRVSWFAARAYCEWRGARLPTTDEWELAARASQDRADAFRDATFNRETLRLVQSRPAADALPPVGQTFQNVHGVWDLHGLVEEWTGDFNNLMVTGAGRDDQGLDRQLFCAAGSVGATDRSDYAAFLRYAFRADLEGSDTGALLGFRCARTP